MLIYIVNQALAVRLTGRGKSGHQMASCKLTACRGDVKDSATENKPPALAGKDETAE